MKIDGVEFKAIEGFTRYLLSRCGRVYSTISNRFMTASKNNRGYFFFSLVSDEGLKKSLSRHRLLAIVFIPTDLDKRDLIVNHLNGIKGDDRVDNLEWTSYVGNLEHAGLMGLSSKCIPCSVLDVDTGEIMEFGSATKAAEFLKLTKDAILYRLRFDPNRVFPERKQYRLGPCEVNWTPNPNPDESIAEYSVMKAVLVKNLDSEEVFEFPTLTAASAHIKHSLSTMSKRLNGEQQPWFPPNYLVQWEEGKGLWREDIDKYLEYEKRTCSKVVILVGEGDNKIFLSASDCAKSMGLNHTTVLYRVNSKSKPFYNGYQFHYYSNYTLGPTWE